MDTLRQRIAQLLRNDSMDAWQLAASMGLHEKDLLDHLTHVARSAQRRGERFRVRPAVCLNCGFQFKERRRLDPPGKCPKCKQARIHGPWYHIDMPNAGAAPHGKQPSGSLRGS